MTEPTGKIRVLLVGRDINSIARLEAAGADVRTTQAGSVGDALGEPVDIVVVDLDAGGDGVLDELASLRDTARLPVRVVGFYSHVDAALGERAESLGVVAVQRGRFWRSLPEVLFAKDAG